MKKIIQTIAIIAIMILSNLKIIAQVDIANHNWVNNYHVGWNTAHNLDFKIGTTPTPLMTLSTTGDLNIYNATTSPTDKTAYQIGGNSVLWHNGHPQDIFVGVGAGNGSMTGRANSCIGNSAGVAITSGDSLTFVGYEAGVANTSGRFNTAVGCLALHSVTDNGMNVAVGYKALYSVHTICGSCQGGENAAVGFEALKNSDAYGGCALGFRAALSNTTGCGIIAIGEEAMYSNTEGNFGHR